MKNSWTRVVFGLLVMVIVSCNKTSFITSPDAFVQTSADTIHFDTVFTTTGSVTQAFKIFNSNNQKLRLSKVKLMGGSASAFKLNVDGTPGVDFTNIELEANDSIYVFVSVAVNPTAANLPFILRDSVLINFNGNDRFVQLDAFGQNANFLRNRRVTKDSLWNNNLPFVILGGLVVDSNIALTINKGTRIYCHADAPIIINGTLKVNGDTSNRVTFRSDRLDPGYRDYPGSWPGIYFNSSSKDNVLNYAIIQNAFQGIITQLPSSNSNPKVTLNECIIDNIYDAGILCLNSSLNARNCLISNCGNNIEIGAGGTYNFTHCTVVTYGSSFIQHKNPVLFISNSNGPSQQLPFAAVFRNCIFYGEGGTAEDEIVVDKKGTAAFALNFQNSLYRSGKTDHVQNYTFSNVIKNQPPQFDSIDASRRIFNFKLGAGSPALGKALPGLMFDLDGKPRGSTPDIGCYERQ